MAGLLHIGTANINDELRHMWSEVAYRFDEWLANVLGRSRALEGCQAWLGTTPGPGEASVTSAFTAVATCERQADNQLQWADRTITGFGWLGPRAGKLYPAGPVVLAIVAAALGGWLIWSSWHFLSNAAAAAS